MNPIKSFCGGSRGAVFSKSAPLAAGGFFLLWFGILALCGTLFSGYHFMDDHGIFRESKEVANSNILKEARIFKRNLLYPKMRFRPFYWAHRRLMLAVMGTNFTAMSIYVGFLAVFTSFFLFLFMKKAGFSWIESVLFVCLTLLGEQAAIWWRLGNNETLGMFMLSIALLFMVLGTSTRQKRKKILYEFLFCLFVILASWSKESFILIIPALIFWKIWLTGTMLVLPIHGEGSLHRSNSISNLKGSIRRMVSVGDIVLLLVCLLELVHVVKNVGTTKIVYAGYEGFQLANFIKTGIQGFMAVHGWVILVLLVILCLRRPGALLKNRPWTPQNFLLTGNRIFWPIILAGLLVVPQIVLYMKSGMMERYLLPGIMGYTLLMVVLLRYARENGGKKLLSVIMMVLLAVVLLQQLRVTRYTAMGFAFEGKQINAWLQSIEQNTDDQDLILVVTHMHKYNEASFSLKMYLDVKSNRENTLFSPANLRIKSAKNRFWKELNKYFFSHFSGFTLKNNDHRDRVQAILVFPGLEEKFLKASVPWFNPAQFKRYTNAAEYVSYYKKRAATNIERNDE